MAAPLRASRKPVENRVAVEAHLHQRGLSFVHVARHLVAHFRLEHVEYGEPQRDSGQRARVGRITGDDGLRERRLILQAHGAAAVQM